MNRWLINQDRDEIIELKEVCKLHTIPVYLKGQLIGVNINYNEFLMGTFDSVVECMQEMNRIINSRDEIICVSGYFRKDNFDLSPLL